MAKETRTARERAPSISSYPWGEAPKASTPAMGDSNLFQGQYRDVPSSVMVDKELGKDDLVLFALNISIVLT